MDGVRRWRVVTGAIGPGTARAPKARAVFLASPVTGAERAFPVSSVSASRLCPQRLSSSHRLPSLISSSSSAPPRDLSRHAQRAVIRKAMAEVVPLGQKTVRGGLNEMVNDVDEVSPEDDDDDEEEEEDREFEFET